MKSLEEETKDLQSQDEQVLPFTFMSCPLSCLIFFPRYVPHLCMSYDIMAPVFLQAQTTLKIYNMNSDRLNRNLETAGEENTLLLESNAQVS